MSQARVKEIGRAQKDPRRGRRIGVVMLRLRKRQPTHVVVEEKVPTPIGTHAHEQLLAYSEAARAQHGVVTVLPVGLPDIFIQKARRQHRAMFEKRVEEVGAAMPDEEDRDHWWPGT